MTGFCIGAVVFTFMKKELINIDFYTCVERMNVFSTLLLLSRTDKATESCTFDLTYIFLDKNLLSYGDGRARGGGGGQSR